ncbi:hypothetical protein [Streptomyces sp. NPDC046805]|uniref:hypothetical protein n=1 Tax=Streptomyces sp. NPDC046805 TaxID=3155134 RepID=UPI0033CE34F0
MKGLRHDGRTVLLGLDPFVDFVVPTDLVQPFFAQRQKFIGATHSWLRYLTEALDLAAVGKVTSIIETFDKTEVVEAVRRVTRRHPLPRRRQVLIRRHGR